MTSSGHAGSAAPTALQALRAAQQQQAALFSGPAALDVALPVPGAAKASPFELPPELMALVMDLATRMRAPKPKIPLVPQRKSVYVDDD